MFGRVVGALVGEGVTTASHGLRARGRGQTLDKPCPCPRLRRREVRGGMPRAPLAQRRLTSGDPTRRSARTDALGARPWRGERGPSHVAGASLNLREVSAQDAAPCDGRGPQGNEGPEVARSRAGTARKDPCVRATTDAEGRMRPAPTRASASRGSWRAVPARSAQLGSAYRQYGRLP